MKIGFYTSRVDRPSTGPGVYREHLFRSLLERSRPDEHIRPIHYREYDSDIYERSNEVIIPQPPLLVPFAERVLGRETPRLERKNPLTEFCVNRADDFDVLHLQSIPYERPFWLVDADTSLVTTIHAIHWFLHPEIVGLYVYHRNKILFRILSKAFDAILTVSLASKRQLVEILQIDESKVHVTPNSVASNYRPTRDENTITEYDITGSYVFHLSNASERKNPQGIIRGFEIARNQFGLDRKLVIAGGRWDESLVREHAKYDETLENVSVLGYTPETDLPVLYTHADGFLFPSLSEGFGIPLLESMSCGTPVLTTDAYAMPEVAGNAGVYVDDPNDYEQIADRLISLIDRRAVLSQRALKQAGEFSWDLTADRTLEVYRKITR